MIKWLQKLMGGGRSRFSIRMRNERIHSVIQSVNLSQLRFAKALADLATLEKSPVAIQASSAAFDEIDKITNVMARASTHAVNAMHDDWDPMEVVNAELTSQELAQGLDKLTREVETLVRDYPRKTLQVA